MSWSGFILYVAPPGRIANWGTWKLMLFTKAEWQALHTIFSYLFFILAIIHLFFINWKVFLTYIKSKLKTGLNKKWELTASLVLSAVFFAGTIYSWVPFGPVMSFGDKVKESWEDSLESPPVIHMETYTLEKLSPLLDSVPPTSLLNTLNKKGIVAESTESTLKKIAEENNMTPSEIYKILVSEYNPKESSVTVSEPGGFGKYTVGSVSEVSGIGQDVLIRKLKEMGIEAKGSTTLKEIAQTLGITPREVYSRMTE